MPCRYPRHHLVFWTIVYESNEFHGSAVSRANFLPRFGRSRSSSEDHDKLRIAGSRPVASENTQHFIKHGTKKEKQNDTCRGCRRRSGEGQIKSEYAAHETAAAQDTYQQAERVVVSGPIESQSSEASSPQQNEKARKRGIHYGDMYFQEVTQFRPGKVSIVPVHHTCECRGERKHAVDLRQPLVIGQWTSQIGAGGEPRSSRTRRDHSRSFRICGFDNGASGIHEFKNSFRLRHSSAL